MKFTLPPETPKGQKDAITANYEIITVEAGAGTGKTWVLSERYLRLLIEDGELLPSDILTLTYTEAAAGEMKARIEGRIQEAMKDFPDAERKQAILDGLSDTWISTIHAFSTRLIRESGLSLDIDPRAAVISAHQEQAFWEEVRRAAEFSGLERLARNYGGGVLYHAAKSLDDDFYMSAAVGKWGAGVLSTFAKKAAELHASSGHSWQDMLSWAEDDSVLLEKSAKMVKDILLSFLLNIRKDWENFRLQNVKKDDKAGNALNEFLASISANPPSDYDGLVKFYERLISDEDIAGRTRVFSQLKEILGGETLASWRKKQKASTIYNIIHSLDEPLTPEEARIRRTILKFCAVCWGMWDMMKSKRGLLSFSDMILHAKRTIEQKGIRRTFKHILVDEFQDTDPLQFGMIETLKNYIEGSSLFAVGDPKQSIYKFRHADPQLFAEISKRKGTRRVNLDMSFRTRAELLSRINSIFSSLWPDGISRQEAMKDVKYNPLDPANPDVERESGTMPPFGIILASNEKGRDNKRLLAEYLAGKISSWVKDGLTVWDKTEKIIRAVKFSDFAILSRGRRCFPILEDALGKFGIPSVQDRSNDYFNRGEIGDVVCTLRAAADFSDDFSVTGWLMSPFSGVSENDAVKKCLDLVDETHRPIDLIRENIPEAYSRLQYLAVVGENEGASGILSYLDRKRQWLSCYDYSDRLRVLRNVRLSMSIAREFEASGTAGLVSCAEYMTRSIRNKAGYEEPSWHDEDENAVRLGAVHSAKGLEYPVTVIFEDRLRRNIDRGRLKPSRELGIVVSNFPDEIMLPENYKSSLNNWHKLLSEQGDSEEEERLFYVACTRAQDSLIFCGLITPKEGKGYAGTWTKMMLENTQCFMPDNVSTESKPDNSQESTKDNENVLCPVSIIRPSRSLRQFSATSFALYEWCPYAWRRSYRQGLSLSWEMPDRDSDVEEFHGGAALGSLAHWVLSRWPKGEDYAEELNALLDKRNNETLKKVPGWLRDTWRNADRSSLREWLMNFAASELGIRLRNTPVVVREYSFRQKLSDETTLAGSIDVVHGNNIVDYKITAIDDVPPGLYESQLDFYSYVLYEKEGAESVNTSIAFLRENKTAERVINDFEPIRERILRAAEICASGPYNPNHKHCGKCPFKKGCVKIAG